MVYPKRKIITIAVMLGMFLSALEITVVGTAAPIIVRELGGFDSFSWLFSMYLLTSTIVMPFWGRAADHWGRKTIFICAMLLFLIGSILCGFASSYAGLVLFRGVQGLGAGGLIPLAFTILTDIYDLKSRTRIQGYLGSVWGVASLIGPFIGGALAETLGWRWIFFINILPGGLAIFFVMRHFQDSYRPTAALRLTLQSLQSSFIFVLTLMLGLHYLQEQSWLNAFSHLAIALLSLILFVHTEKKAKNPLIPPKLFQFRIYTMTCISGFLSSAIIISLSSFIPLLYQVVLGYSPTSSGLVLFPFTVSWIIFGILSAKLLLTVRYKTLLALGFVLMNLGLGLFMITFFELNLILTLSVMLILGAGMAFNYPVLLISTQYAVPKDLIGFSTSGIFWIRNLGSTIGITVMGMILTWRFKMGLSELPAHQNLLKNKLENQIDYLLRPETLTLIKASPEAFYLMQKALYASFWVIMICALLTLMTWFFFPSQTQNRKI